MTTWFTSDLHFNHINIINYSNRPFANLDEMNKALINNYNQLVNHDDMVIFVGDVCMGKRESTLPLLYHLNGFKVLIPGNHDYCHPMFGDSNYEKWQINLELYKQYFDDIILDDVYLYQDFVVCHFPYDVNSTDHGGRNFDDYQPLDLGMPLLCGHVHQDWKIKMSPKGTFMMNVGVDVHDFKPVSFETIQDCYRTSL